MRTFDSALVVLSFVLLAGGVAAQETSSEEALPALPPGIATVYAPDGDGDLKPIATAFLATSSGYMVTVAHAVDGNGQRGQARSQVKVRFCRLDARPWYAATVVDVHLQFDLALLKVDGAAGLPPPVPLAPSVPSPKVGVGVDAWMVGVHRVHAAAPAQPCRLKKTTLEDRTSSGTLAVAEGVTGGFSGGPLLDAEQKALGVIRTRSRAETVVIPVEQVAAFLRRFGIEPGAESPWLVGERVAEFGKRMREVEAASKYVLTNLDWVPTLTERTVPRPDGSPRGTTRVLEIKFTERFDAQIEPTQATVEVFPIFDRETGSFRRTDLSFERHVTLYGSAAEIFDIDAAIDHVIEKFDEEHGTDYAGLRRLGLWISIEPRRRPGTEHEETAYQVWQGRALEQKESEVATGW